MGRWDALKPNDNSSPKQSHHSTSSRLNWNKPRKQDSTIGYQSPQHSIASDFANQLCFYRSRSNKFDPSKVTKMLNDVRSASIEVQASVSLVHLVRLLEIDHETIQKKSWYLINKKICDSKQDFKKYELEECISVISEHAKSNKGASYQSVGCLARLVSSHAKDLPAEVTVRNIVGPIMLPELQHANGIEANQVSICDAIERFLSNSRFASAMLVSLVQDVSPDGKEETITNGIRINLFRSLQNLLFSEFTSNRLKSKACSTLASVIETLRKTNESRNDTTVHYLDQAKLEAFLCQNLDNQHPLYRPSLLLIRALLRMYRMTSLCSMLLFPGPPTQCQFAYSKDVPCRYCFCQMSAFSPFLSSIHKAIAMKSSGLAFDCAIEFVTALPLNHWLMQQTGKSAPVLVSGFYRKVVDSLINILAITRCAVLQQRRDWDDSLGRLCTTVLLIIPWNDERLLKAGEALWSTLAKTFQDNQNVAIASIMIMSMGGRVNPQGRLPPMALPACRFLSCQEHSIPFVRMLLSHIQIGDTSSSSLDLFYAMLRTRPESALILWTDFELVLRGAESGDKKRGGICLCVLEAFLLGRHNFPSDGMKGLEETGIVSELTFYVLEATKEYNSSKICCRRLNCYALLTQRDWDYLELDLDRLSEQVHGLLGLCKDELKDVRKEACRAMGEICSNYMTFQRLSTPLGASISLEIGGRLCCIMTDVLKQDENASVRAMVSNVHVCTVTTVGLSPKLM